MAATHRESTTARRNVSPEMLMLLQKQLGRDEAVLWTTQPLPTSSKRRENMLGGIMLLFFGGFLAWLLWPNMLSGNFTLVNLLVILISGTPLLVVGVWYLNAAKTYHINHLYAITNRRLIVLSTQNWRVHVKSYGKRQVNALKIQHLKEDGSGDLIFYQEHRGKYVFPVGFFGIPRVQSVKHIIIDAFGFDEGDYW